MPLRTGPACGDPGSAASAQAATLPVDSDSAETQPPLVMRQNTGPSLTADIIR
jgi:hypothetical protein